MSVESRQPANTYPKPSFLPWAALAAVLGVICLTILVIAVVSLHGWFRPYVLYSETIVTIEAEGERIDVHNFGRCFVRSHRPAGAPRASAQFFPNGSVPAVKLPSGAVVLIGLGSNGSQALTACWGMRFGNRNLMTFDPLPEPVATGYVSPLRQGSTGSVNLSRMFERREGLFSAWIDDPAEPTEIVGYLDKALLDNPGAKFRLIDVKFRLLSEEEWGDRDVTRIEDTVPWIAKYCPRRELEDLMKDRGWSWSAPFTTSVSLNDLPEGSLKKRLQGLSSGIHKVDLDEIERLPSEWSEIRRALPLHSFTKVDEEFVSFDPQDLSADDTLRFYKRPHPTSLLGGFNVVVANHEIVRRKRSRRRASPI